MKTFAHNQSTRLSLLDALEKAKVNLRERLQVAPPVVLIIFASITSFSLYTCIYAYRKTFAAATFAGISIWGIDYKIWLVTFQVLGYALSKFLGIKLISELKYSRRRQTILTISIIAAFTWLGFALIPPPLNFVFLFANGLALGLVWGVVFSYLEGRRVTEVLAAALSTSFIFSSAFCRTIGAYVLSDWNVQERWMPFVVSLLFTVPMLVLVWLMDMLPAPTLADQAQRSVRKPMSATERKNFITRFLPGIVVFVIAYMLLTAFRDFRDNFSAEIWKELHVTSAHIYSTTDTPVAIFVLVVIASTMAIRSNFRALVFNHLLILTGLLLIAFSNYMFSSAYIDPVAWMMLIGMGLYLAYVPFNSIFFDRLVATYCVAGNVGFIMYVADSFGYLGSIGALFVKQFSSRNSGWVAFIIESGNAVSTFGSMLMILSLIYFSKKKREPQTSEPAH